MLERLAVKQSRAFYLLVFFLLVLVRLLFVPEVNLPERLSEQLQANPVVSISFIAAIVMVFTPLMESLLSRSKPIWRRMAALVCWALALVYVSEHYVFTTFFIMGLAIVDSLVGARQPRQARRRIPRFYLAYTAALLANAFWLQNLWLLVAVFLIGVGEHFLSHRLYHR